MTDNATIGEVFPAGDPRSLFVMAMCMARNDLRIDIERGKAAAGADNPEWRYFSKQTYVHLFEAIDALNQWCNGYPEVKALLNALSNEARGDLKTVRGTLQRVGYNVVEHVRNSTSHYPSPDARYTTEAQLRDIVSDGKDVLVNATFKVGDPLPTDFTFEFADLAALALAFAKHSADPNELRRQDLDVHEGAMAFLRFSHSLFEKWAEMQGASYGEPYLVDQQGPEKGRASDIPEAGEPAGGA